MHRDVPRVMQEPPAGHGVPGNAHLWVLEEGVLVVDAATTAVLLWVLMLRPGAVEPGLLPCLVDAQVGRVDQAAFDDVREVPAHVLKGHPGREEGLSRCPRPVTPPCPARPPICSEPQPHRSELDMAPHRPLTSLSTSVSSFVKCK